MKKHIIHKRANQKLSLYVMIVAFVVTMIMSIQNVQAQFNYYVGGANASDSNPGTASQPFATIQRAATFAVDGNTINIRTGTYRETITPVNSGVTYQPDQGASVVISGLNEVGSTGWTVYNGNIYKKTIILPVNGYNISTTQNRYPTAIYANQIFKDGEMQFEAR